MRATKNNRYAYVLSTTEPNKMYMIDRCTHYNLGDAVAVNYGNLAKVKHYTDKTNLDNILGKVIWVIRKL